MLQTIQLSKTYSRDGASTSVLRGVDLDVKAGESLAIVGPSGAGKSTLLHIMGALDHPSGGELLFEGENLFAKSEKSLCEYRNKTIGFVFQFHHLLPDFSALENVMLPLLIRGLSNHYARIQAETFLEKVGLAGRLSHRPSELSGGEQQRVAIARALVGGPRLVLADEPTGNLDAETGRKIFDLLLALNKELQTTLVIVTHNEDLALRLEQRVYMSDGILHK